MKFAIIGCGNLGTAIVRAVVKQSVVAAADLTIIERAPDKREQLGREFNVTVQAASSDELLQQDVILIAVKPQDARATLKSIAPFTEKLPLLISVMAGVTIASMHEFIESSVKIVRSIPNLASQISQGVTGYYAEVGIGARELQIATRIFESFGTAIQVSDERLIDSITAVSASGPAYFFYFVEHLIAVGRELGLGEKESQAAVLGTMQGALGLLQQEHAQAAELRRQVTSPNGTTAAAISVFESGRLGQVLEEGARAAFRRAIELSK